MSRLANATTMFFFCLAVGMANPKPLLTRISAARRAVVFPDGLAPAMAALARIRAGRASSRLNLSNEPSDKGDRIGIKGTADLNRFNDIDPSLTCFVFAHVALRHAQEAR
jgi:hypothetical protein